MENSPLPNLTLVLGGVSSGKSTFAESLVTATGQARFYIATAQSFDAEMAQKIAGHKVDRGPDWITIEEPMNIASAMEKVTDTGVILLDCASMWLTNIMIAGTDLDAAIPDFMGALNTTTAPIVVVSNEVGLGGICDNTMARQFARAQGRLNSTIAAQADAVYLVAAGIPLKMK